MPHWTLVSKFSTIWGKVDCSELSLHPGKISDVEMAAHCEYSCAYIDLLVFLKKKKKKKGLLIFWWSENLLECSDRPHIVPTCSTHQFYRLREFQGDRSTLPDKKVDFLIWGEAISLGTPSYFEGVPICEWFFRKSHLFVALRKYFLFLRFL